MDCHIDKPSRSLLRYIKKHNGIREKEIIGYFKDHNIYNALHILFNNGCIECKETYCRSFRAEDTTSISLINRRWEITPKGREYLSIRFCRYAPLFLTIVGIAVNVVLAVLR